MLCPNCYTYTSENTLNKKKLIKYMFSITEPYNFKPNVFTVRLKYLAWDKQMCPYRYNFLSLSLSYTDRCQYLMALLRCNNGKDKVRDNVSPECLLKSFIMAASVIVNYTNRYLANDV